MIRLLAALCLTLLMPVYDAQARDFPQADTYAVYVYADWCPNCKILSPEIEEAKEKGDLNRQDVLFVTFDLTDKARIHQSMMLAHALGLEEWLKQQGSATGYLALIDADSKDEAQRFTSANSDDEILTGLTSRND